MSKLIFHSNEIAEIRRLLDQAAEDPARAPSLMRRAREISYAVSQAPYSASRLFLPGLMFPATTVIEVSNIPLVLAGTTSNPVPIDIRSPGVLVGLMGASLPNNDQVERAQLAFQLTLENVWKFASTGLDASQAFASYATFGIVTPWLPVMIPVRGTGGFSCQFRNTGPGSIQPVFNLGFLQGKEALSACGFGLESP
jgi:hypothetical protein